ISDEDEAAERAKVLGRPRHTPRRIERSAARETPQQMAISVEHVDKAVAGTGHVIMLVGILLCIADEEIAVDVLDAERGVAGRDRWVLEAAVGGYQFIVVVEDVDRSTSKVSRKEEDAADVCAENKPFVDRK